MGEKNRKKNLKIRIWILSAAIAGIFLLGVFFIIRALVSDNGSRRERQIQMVTLMKPPPPPPPPEIEEQPPEPEVEEKIVEPEQANDESIDEGDEMTDPGENLGLDADGVAGADGFGLVAKKGGKALIGGDMGNSALLRKFAWYTRMIQAQIQDNLRKLFDKDGGLPDGTLEATVRIVLNDRGRINAFKIVDSSGNSRLDMAINKALKQVDIDMAPPYDMPRSIKIKVSSKG